MNQKGESIPELISLAAMGAFMIVPWFIIGLHWWGWMFVLICVIVLVWELVSQLTLKKTISRQFWLWSIKVDESYTGTNKWKKHPNIWKALLVLASMQIGWFMLLFHLAIKLIHVLMS